MHSSFCIIYGSTRENQCQVMTLRGVGNVIPFKDVIRFLVFLDEWGQELLQSNKTANVRRLHHLFSIACRSLFRLWSKQLRLLFILCESFHPDHRPNLLRSWLVNLNVVRHGHYPDCPWKVSATYTLSLKLPIISLNSHRWNVRYCQKPNHWTNFTASGLINCFKHFELIM